MDLERVSEDSMDPLPRSEVLTSLRLNIEKKSERTASPTVRPSGRAAPRRPLKSMTASFPPAEEDEDEEDGEPPPSKVEERKFTAVPKGLSAEEAEYVPDRTELEDAIQAIDGEALVRGMKMPAEAHSSLELLLNTWKNVNSNECAVALNKCNEANAAKVTRKYIRPVQQHVMGGAARVGVFGSFPVKGAMEERTLSAPANPTVMVTAAAQGCMPEQLIDVTITFNRMPTTLDGDYTLCPSEADYGRFRAEHVKLIERLINAGVKVALPPACGGALALYV